MESSAQTTSSASPVTILAIVVIYRLHPMESPSVITLLAAEKAAAIKTHRLRIIVADNTPGGQHVGELPAGIEYRAYPDNPGLSQPYNDAVAVAAECGFDWLLTLDQDTHLPLTFLDSMAASAAFYSGDGRVASVVPHIEDEGRMISPLCYQWGFFPVVLPASARGIAPHHASAINSASLLRAQMLLEVGGYDLNFPLHNSDTRLYQKLDEAGKLTAIADVSVHHELSILNREQRITPERYRSMLRDECRFWDRHMNMFGRTERIVRLIGRYVRGIFRRESRAFLKLTADEIRYRLTTRRTIRMKYKP